MDQLLEPSLLTLGIGCCQLFGVRHTQALQNGQRATEAWFPSHMGLVHRSREAIRRGDALERFTPRSLMRRCEQDTIDVEDASH